MDRRQRLGGEGGRVEQHLTTAQGAKAGVEMVELRRGQLERHHPAVEEARDLLDRRENRALPVAGPEELARPVPDGVSGAFLEAAFGEHRHLVEQAARAHVLKRRVIRRLFALPLGTGEAGHDRPAVQHHGGVGGKHHVRLALHARHDLHGGPGTLERAAQRIEAGARLGGVACRVRRPGTWLHPGIDHVADVEMRGIDEHQARVCGHGATFGKERDDALQAGAR